MSMIDDSGTPGRASMGFGKSTKRVMAARRALVAGLMAVVSSFVAAPAALAANADRLKVEVIVKPVDSAGSAVVTLSRPGLPTYISVKMLVTNGGTNTINKVAVQGTTTVYQGALPNGAVAGYTDFVNLGAASPNCTAPATPASNTVTCAIGQLASQQTREFFLIFTAPSTGTGVNFHAHADFSSGNSDNAPPADFDPGPDQDIFVTLTESLTPDSNKRVKTVLPPGGGDFFTGPNAAVSFGNPVSTKVNVPPVTDLVTENFIELANPTTGATTCTVGMTTFTCFGLESTIEVKYAKTGTSPSTGDRVYFPDNSPTILKILLRQDVSTLGAKPYPKIQDVKIFYTSHLPLAVPAEVLPCTAAGPAANVPCIPAGGRINAIKGNKGYYEYLIHARDNGKFSW